jgi:hypothetical protein
MFTSIFLSLEFMKLMISGRRSNINKTIIFMEFKDPQMIKSVILNKKLQ